ncbi:uncharacterized protein LOC126370830 [Pectinophora gossypiella]|uniref:uncharacterized protein LOC126370830 n=1 Tax=Pectinophora gossypiella TaxID=13191 RepID=UPI00214F19F8|nr:uncharacterized protein LOC126370830 [Pectinophora gossypiella]
MACEVCEHCQEPLTHGSVVREGCSYHAKCHKCYVCSETNLQDAEVFKGVIFCSSCSKRIFQGCASARRSKGSDRSKPARSKSRPKWRQRARTVERRSERERIYDTGVLELARLVHSFETDSRYSKRNKFSKSSIISAVSHVDNGTTNDDVKKMKKDSMEMGVTTDVTQELLKEMNCPVVDLKNNKEILCQNFGFNRHRERKRRDGSPRRHRMSDLRMSELGASTEIATMMLRKQSDAPVTIRSRSHADTLNSGVSFLSDATIKGLEEWLESTEAMKRSTQLRLIDRSLRSLLKIPYKFFKRHILDRSSLISVLMSANEDDRTLFSKVRSFFHEEITQHHRRGVRRLYSTINRRQTPYKLGWLHLSPVHCLSRHKTTCRYHTARCKHYRNSHSYRCLRAYVMRHAGPTKSELALFRAKISRAIAPQFVRNLLVYRQKMMSAGCGNSDAQPQSDSNKVSIHIKSI